MHMPRNAVHTTRCEASRVVQVAFEGMQMALLHLEGWASSKVARRFCVTDLQGFGTVQWHIE
jgi:hypothetical protein